MNRVTFLGGTGAAIAAASLPLGALAEPMPSIKGTLAARCLSPYFLRKDEFARFAKDVNQLVHFSNGDILIEGEDFFVPTFDPRKIGHNKGIDGEFISLIDSSVPKGFYPTQTDDKTNNIITADCMKTRYGLGVRWNEDSSEIVQWVNAGFAKVESHRQLVKSMIVSPELSVELKALGEEYITEWTTEDHIANVRNPDYLMWTSDVYVSDKVTPNVMYFLPYPDFAGIVVQRDNGHIGLCTTNGNLLVKAIVT